MFVGLEILKSNLAVLVSEHIRRRRLSLVALQFLTGERLEGDPSQGLVEYIHRRPMKETLKIDVFCKADGTQYLRSTHKVTRLSHAWRLSTATRE